MDDSQERESVEMAAAAVETDIPTPADPGSEGSERVAMNHMDSGVTGEVEELDGRFVLQVGAFRTLEQATRAEEQIGLENLRVIPTRRDSEDWYVLVLGSYQSRVDAREAGEVYLDANPRGSIWVRSAEDLRGSRVDQ